MNKNYRIGIKESEMLQSPTAAALSVDCEGHQKISGLVYTVSFMQKCVVVCEVQSLCNQTSETLVLNQMLGDKTVSIF